MKCTAVPAPSSNHTTLHNDGIKKKEEKDCAGSCCAMNGFTYHSDHLRALPNNTNEKEM